MSYDGLGMENEGKKIIKNDSEVPGLHHWVGGNAIS